MGAVQEGAHENFTTENVSFVVCVDWYTENDEDFI